MQKSKNRQSNSTTSDTSEDLHSEKPAVIEAPNEPVKSAVQLAELVVQYRAGSVASQVQSTLAFSQGLTLVKASAEDHTAFLMALFRAKIITYAEATAPSKNASTKSKWNKIAQYAPTFLDARVLNSLPTGYSVMYELALLLDDVGGSVDQLVEFIDKHDGPLTRVAVESKREALKPPEIATVATSPSISPAEDDEKFSEGPGQGEIETPKTVSGRGAITEPLADLVGGRSIQEVDEPIDAAPIDVSDGNRQAPMLIPSVETAPDELAQFQCEASDVLNVALVTVTESEASQLAELNTGGSPPVYPAAAEIAADAVIFVLTEVRTLVRLDALMRLFNADRCSAVYLLSEDSSKNIATCNVLVVCQRGLGAPLSEVEFTPNGMDAFAIAEHLANRVQGRRVNFFAKSSVPGWESVGGPTFDL